MIHLQNQQLLQGPGPGDSRAIPEYIEELRLPTQEYGPHEEPERYVTRWINKQDYTPDEWEGAFRKHRQAWSNNDMIKDQRQAAEAEHEAHERSIKEWEG